MIDPEDVARIEAEIRVLARDLAHAREEREACDAAVGAARAALDDAVAALAPAERVAKERRHARHETVRGRAELEHRLATILEAEGLARSRAERAEGLAQGYRGAAAFASIAASEAESAAAWARAERERLVAERASRECALAETRAAEERAEERKLAVARAEVELHLAAEREIEATLGSERIDAELTVSAIRATIATATTELRAAEAALADAGERSERIADDARALRHRLHDATTNVRGTIEARIADLRRIERETIAERIEHERTLERIIENEMRAAGEARAAAAAAAALARREREAAEAREREAAEARERELAAERGAERGGPDHVPETPSVAAGEVVEPAGATHGETAPIEPPAPATLAAASARPAAAKAADDDLIPGLLGLFGTIFSRRPASAAQAASAADSTSVADRIARDFGWIGAGAGETPPALREEVRDLEPERLGREGLQ